MVECREAATVATFIHLARDGTARDGPRIRLWLGSNWAREVSARRCFCKMKKKDQHRRPMRSTHPCCLSVQDGKQKGDFPHKIRKEGVREVFLFFPMEASSLLQHSPALHGSVVHTIVAAVGLGTIPTGHVKFEHKPFQQTA